MVIATTEKITPDLFERDIIGIKYQVDKIGVNISTFTPSLVQSEKYMDNYGLSLPRNDSNYFRVSLVSPFFLPLRNDLCALYGKSLRQVSELLNKNDSVEMTWIFKKKRSWRESAIDMYESYLRGNDNPSDSDLFRKMEDKLHKFISHLSPPLERREYSKDVEEKILDDGYQFQCIIQIRSPTCKEVAIAIQRILMEYDFYNGLNIESIEYQNPNIFKPTNQLLSRGEIFSLLFNEVNVIEDTEEDQLQEPGRVETQTNNELSDKVKLLPTIQKEQIKIDDSIIPRLAESLKRVGVIKQARLYNESIELGSRLTVVNADIPKGKNFSDVEKKKKDIQAAMGVQSLSVEQGDEAGTIKYSIPHNAHQMVSLREIIERDDFHKYQKDHTLSFISGVDEIGDPIYLSLKELRHILITGSQGSGKSVFVNQLLTTLLLTHTPDELNLILIDPKQVELHQYEQFPHVQEVITNMNRAVKTFNSLIKEMENRYKLFKESNVKDLEGYNKQSKEPIPYTVCVVEEWADLFAIAGKDAEEVVLRLGQMARAAGIFLVIITQRPSAKILSGDIKANLRSKFSFNLGSNTNYRTVFDVGIPYKLLGKGDGAFQIEGYHKEFQRFQSPIISTNQEDESEVYEKLAESYSNYSQTDVMQIEEDNKMLDKLKKMIATTRETRTTVLREKMGVKNQKLYDLMNELVNERWLIKHSSRSKGYELVADDEKLNEWSEADG